MWRELLITPCVIKQCMHLLKHSSGKAVIEVSLDIETEKRGRKESVRGQEGSSC